MRLRTVLLLGVLIAVAFPAVASAKRPRLRATVTLLPGSTLTASVPEPLGTRPVGPAHATRSWPVTGALDARPAPALSARFDAVDVPFRGSLALASPAPDPLCPAAAAPPSQIDIVAPSKMWVLTNGTLSWNLVIRGGPAQVFGCGTAALAGTTTLSLRGRTEIRTLTPPIRTLNRVPLSGVLSDIALSDGATGRLTASLNVRVDLRHRR